MLDNKKIKTSIYTNSTFPIISNDFTGKSIEYDQNYIDILKYFSQKKPNVNSFLLHTLIKDAEKKINFLSENQFIVNSSEEEASKFNPLYVDMEINTHCNARCLCCPQSVYPKKPNTMLLKTFEAILDKLSDYDIRWIALSNYGEPLLDKYFLERLNILKNYKFKLHFFTNAILFTDIYIKKLAEIDIESIVFNIPSIHINEWSLIMNIDKKYCKMALQNISNFLLNYSNDFDNKYYIVVNGNKDLQRRLQEIYTYFNKKNNIDVRGYPSNSRAGLITSDWVTQDKSTPGEYYAGCPRTVNHLHISWQGYVYSCLQDYSQKYIWGNLLKESIKEIMSKKHPSLLRKELYGILPLRENRLCVNCCIRKKQFFDRREVKNILLKKEREKLQDYLYYPL